VFSALDSSVAGDAEAAFARAGRMVFSNAKNHRMLPDVPLLIPEINADHICVLDAQRKRMGWNGAIITNANCAATIAALALAPLHERFTVQSLFLATMQAVSGAGYPGVPSLDILGNVIPYIADEEPKLEAEMGKLLGTVRGDAIHADPMRVTSHTNRVAVKHGHTVCMSIGLATKCTPQDAERTIAEWLGHPDTRTLPSRPKYPVVVSNRPDRPQPLRDIDAGAGMTVTVGRIREDALLDLRLVAMGSNTIRGAAGGSILNAELLVSRGLIQHS
jgi:aspartate-semialdehyde dehydrogenase